MAWAATVRSAWYGQNMGGLDRQALTLGGHMTKYRGTSGRDFAAVGRTQNVSSSYSPIAVTKNTNCVSPRAPRQAVARWSNAANVPHIVAPVRGDRGSQALAPTAETSDRVFVVIERVCVGSNRRSTLLPCDLNRTPARSPRASRLRPEIQRLGR